MILEYIEVDLNNHLVGDVLDVQVVHLELVVRLVERELREKVQRQWLPGESELVAELMEWSESEIGLVELFDLVPVMPVLQLVLLFLLVSLIV